MRECQAQWDFDEQHQSSTLIYEPLRTFDELLHQVIKMLRAP